MNKVLSLAYFAGGSKFTLDPFLDLKNSKHDFIHQPCHWG